MEGANGESVKSSCLVLIRSYGVSLVLLRVRTRFESRGKVGKLLQTEKTCWGLYEPDELV